MKKVKLGLLVMAASLFMGCASNVKDGVALLEEKNYKEAVTCFQTEIKAEKNLDEAYRGLGIAYFELGEFEEAAEAFENALTNEADETATIYSLLGASYLQAESYEEALEAYTKALQQKDCSDELKQEILYNEIAVYEGMGNWDTVKEKVDAYVAAYPEDARLEKTLEFLETR